jgi:hypothetical protein
MHHYCRVLLLASLPLFLCGCGSSRQLPLEQNSETENAPDQEQPKVGFQDRRSAEIARGIKQLGSPDVSEREAAKKALEGIGVPALRALRKAAQSDDAEVARAAANLVESIEKDFDQLLADYLGYGLPLPPKDARLVRFESGGRYVSIDKLMPPTYSLGFLLRPATRDKPALLFVGTQEVSLAAHKTIEFVEPERELVKRTRSFWGPSPFEMNVEMALALQCKARGWNDLAEELWTANAWHASGFHFAAFYQPPYLPQRTALAYLAWAQIGNDLVKPDTDRVKIAQRMKALFAAEPRLNTEGLRALLKSLEVALVPSTSREGTVERMIDDLTEICNTGRSWDNSLEPRYARLAHVGLAAVPALIDHLDDNRLTRSIEPGVDNVPTWIVRVKHVVSELLQELAGEELGKHKLERQRGWAVEKRDAQAWWDRVRNEGEKAYFLARVLPRDEKTNWPNTLMLSIIAEKYPEHLPGLYRTILDERPNIDSRPVAEALARSALPAAEKREVFLYASHHKNLRHRQVGLRELQPFDPQEFMTILLATLEALPGTPAEPYWLSPEAGFAHLVLRTDDPRAWKMLEKVAKRSDVGLRMELMKPMDSRDPGDRHQQQRLDFLAAFLGDAETPDVKANEEMFSGPSAGTRFRQWTVRDLAALQIATILQMGEHPDWDWTPQQWENLRTRVNQALKR